MSEQQYVNYTVSIGEGPDEFQAGPYSIEEADIHKRDIAGYWGVTNVYLTPYRDDSRKLAGGQVEDGSG